jgi:hypothetical protein
MHTQLEQSTVARTERGTQHMLELGTQLELPPYICTFIGYSAVI